MKILLTMCLLAPAGFAVAEPLLLRISMDANGPMSEMIEYKARADALAAEIHGEQSKTTATLVADVFHGETGGASLLIRHESPMAFAQASAKQNASSEWRALMQQFPEDNFPTRYQGLSSVVYQSDNYAAPVAGEVVSVFGFQSQQDDAAALIDFVKQAGVVGRKLGNDEIVEVMVPMATGAMGNAALILVRHKNMEAWAAALERQESSDEWRALFQQFPQHNYSISYRGMSVVVD